MPWLRCRFQADAADYRPVTFPPPGPFWCSGHGDDHSIVVAYVKYIDQVKEFWPEAEDIDIMQEDVEIEFTERFSKPSWWEGEKGQ